MYTITAKFSGKEEVLAALNELGTIPVKKVKAALNNWRYSLSNEIAKSVTYSPLKRRSGALLRSAADRRNITVVERDQNTLVVQFEKTLISYAYAHEAGTLIKPKGKFLAIPLRGKGQPTDASGKPLPLGSYREQENEKKGSTFLARSKSGGGYTVLWKRSGQKPLPIYLLRSQVQLPKRAWFEEAVIRAIPSLRSIITKYQGMEE
jgi:hypothetical protein